MPIDSDIKDLLQKLQPVVPTLVKKLWYLNFFSGDGKSAKWNEDLVEILANRYAKIDHQENIRLPPPYRDITPGKYYLGDIIYPEEPYSAFGLTDQDLLRHVLIVGMTGAGKTNLTLQLLMQLAEQGIPFLIFDWKQNYRRLNVFQRLPY